MLDLHTHILPGMDDGSKSVKQSLAMLSRESKQGIRNVVLTPHFYPHRESPESFLKRRKQAYLQLRKAIPEQAKLPRLHLGAEVAYYSGISRSDAIDEMCIHGTRTMLIEMPFSRWGSSVISELNYLRECRGIRPVIAHMERYMFYQPLGTVRHLREQGMWLQVNTSFFLSRKTAWLATAMLKRQYIQFIASDCHDLQLRPPNVRQALNVAVRRLDKSVLRYLNAMEHGLWEE